jgi:hypothetical protein
MKAFLVSLAALFLLVETSLAQTNAVDLVQAAQAREASLTVHRTFMQRIFGMNVSYGGALMPRSKMRRAPKPAPNQPFENVSVNPLTGRAEGISLLSIHF